MRRAHLIGSTLPGPGTRPDTSEMWRDTERAPHWSVGIEWRPGRWDPIATAPRGMCREVRGRDIHGNVFESMHWADGGGEEQPAFTGWFIPKYAQDGKTVLVYSSVRPIEWQPMSVAPSVGDFDSLMERQRAAPAPTPWVPTITGHVDCGECPRISTGCFGTCDKGRR